MRKGTMRGFGPLRLLAAVIAAFGLATVVAACGSDDSDGEQTTSGIAAADVESASGTIDVAGWQFYETKDQDAGSVEADWDYYSTDPDILIKAKAGDADVLSSSSSTMDALEALQALQPIDTSLLSNYESIPASLRDDETWKNADGQVVGVPYAASVAVTAYDTSQVPEPETLEDFLDPVYEDGIGLFDAPDTLAQIAVAQGVEDTTKITQEEFDEALAFLEEMRPNVKAFFGFGEDVQLFNRGDIVLSISSFGSVLSKAVEKNPAIEWNLLAEATYIDAWSILDGGDEAKALNWIDRTLTTKGQEAIVDASGSYPAVPDAIPALTAFGDPVSTQLGELSFDEILAEAPPARGFAPEGDGDVVTIDEATRAWNDYKSGF